MKLFPFLPDQPPAQVETAPPRKPWVAALLSFISPGLGHLYAARPRHALAFAIADVLWSPAWAFAWALSPFAPVALWVLGAGGSLALRVMATVWAARDAKKRSQPLPRETYQMPLVYFLFLVGFFIIGQMAQVGVRARAVEFISAGEAVASPLLPGDAVLVRKAGDSARPRQGALAVLEPPGEVKPGAPLLFYRVASVGDEQFTATDPTGATVGPLPREKYVGEAVAVYWSSGPAGVRWDRIGLSLRQ